MSHHHHVHGGRRNFLRLSGALAAAGLGSLGAALPGVARASIVNDYKALICLYIFGGNDGANTVVPLDAAWNSYYRNIRGGLALTGTRIIGPITANGAQYGLNYGLVEMQNLFNQGHVAILANVGNIAQPLTRAQYLAGTAVPAQLFSHVDQTIQVQTSNPVVNGTGWGGRLLDHLAPAGGNGNLASVSLNGGGAALYTQGITTLGNAIPTTGDLALPRMTTWDVTTGVARQNALNEVLNQDGGNLMRGAANKAFRDGLALSGELSGLGNGTLRTAFPGTDLGNQLKRIAQIIQVKSRQGPGRQVFFAGIGGFDTHGGQDWAQFDGLRTISQAVNAFYSAMVEVGAANSVTLFTQSEFGRSLQPSGGGTDHGWGSNHFVVGGAVRGGVYGRFPDPTLGGPDDATSRGTYIPTTSIEQMGATLGKWFGANPQELALVFPTLSRFSVHDVGFMG